MSEPLIPTKASTKRPADAELVSTEDGDGSPQAASTLTGDVLTKSTKHRKGKGAAGAAGASAHLPGQAKNQSSPSAVLTRIADEVDGVTEEIELAAHSGM